MTTYSEFRFYSPLLDSEAARLSMANERGQEYFSVIPAEVSGKAYRAARDEALDLIEHAIMVGLEPGEVRAG